jgi:serine/threonine protein kinase
MFTVLEGLGRGGFSTVVKVQHLATNQMYAMKVIPKDDSNVASRIENNKDEIMMELYVMKEISMSCPFLQRCYHAFESINSVFFIMDLNSGGDLFYHLSEHVMMSGIGLEEDTCRTLLAEIYLALKYLHKHNILHRDVKVENIMLDASGHVKLVDFGVSIELKRHEDDVEEVEGGLIMSPTSSTHTTKNGNHSNQSSSSAASASSSPSSSSSSSSATTTQLAAAGSVIYMSPELIKDNLSGNFTDWWAYGIVAFELLTGKSPWSSLTNTEAIKWEIVKKDVTCPSHVSSDTTNFITALLNKDYNRRLGTESDEEIKLDPFFTGVNWEAMARLECEPAFVPSAINVNKEDQDEALEHYHMIMKGASSLVNDNQWMLGLDSYSKYLV